MATMNHSQIIFFASILFIIIIATNLVVASSSFVEIAPNDSEHNSATADTDRMIRPTFPQHWGAPPKIQTRDYVQLPGDYGRGSGTLRNWILKKMEEDEQQGSAAAEASSSGAFEEEAVNRSSSPATWPEKDMVGWAGEDAKAAILAEQSFLNVMIVPENSMLTMDYREDRVRVMVDENGKVVRQPRIG